MSRAIEAEGPALPRCQRTVGRRGGRPSGLGAAGGRREGLEPFHSFAKRRGAGQHFALAKIGVGLRGVGLWLGLTEVENLRDAVFG